MTKKGRPVTRVIDIMLTDENSLYFITAKGKAFYSQLMTDPYVAISGMCGGEGTMKKKAVSIRGKAVKIGSEKLKEVFRQNPYMAEIYPQEESRRALEVFQVAEGTGEFFDLSVKPIYRDTFVLGAGQQETEEPGGYFITDRCPRLPYLLFQVSPKMYRYVGQAFRYSAGALPPLWKLYGGPVPLTQ